MPVLTPLGASVDAYTWPCRRCGKPLGKFAIPLDALARLAGQVEVKCARCGKLNVLAA